MTLGLWLAAGLAALVVALWVWLAVLDIGFTVKGQLLGAPITVQIIRRSPFALLVRWLSGVPSSHANGITLFGRIHLSHSVVTRWLLCHEIGHALRSEGNHWGYLWRYVTSSTFRRYEEAECDAFANAYRDEPFIVALIDQFTRDAARMPKGKA